MPYTVFIMNKYLWSWIAVSMLFLIWTLGSLAAKRNNYISFTDTWLGMIYLTTGLLLIFAEIFFWIMGMKEMLSEEESKTPKPD